MEKLIVPVYLNQRLVFDQIAMLKKGISMVTTVTQSEYDSTSKQSNVSTGIGSGGVLSSLLNVNLTSGLTKAGDQQSETETQANRVHTPASLFYELRNQLKEEGLLVTLTHELPAPGNFVEFECHLNRNPLLVSLETAMEIGSLSQSFITPSKEKTPRKRKSRSRNSDQNHIQQNNDPSIAEAMKNIKIFVEMLAEGNTLDLVSMNINDSFSAVITLEVESLNDPQMSDLVDGQFKVLGVVTKSICDNTDSISLVRKTKFSRLPPSVLEPLFKGLTEFQDTLELDLPLPIMEVHGPAIQILPVSIFA